MNSLALLEKKTSSISWNRSIFGVCFLGPGRGSENPVQNPGVPCWDHWISMTQFVTKRAPKFVVFSKDLGNLFYSYHWIDFTEVFCLVVWSQLIAATTTVSYCYTHSEPQLHPKKIIEIKIATRKNERG